MCGLQAPVAKVLKYAEDDRAVRALNCVKRRESGG